MRRGAIDYFDKVSKYFDLSTYFAWSFA